MYNEEGLSLRGLIVKILLVVLFVFLLMWLFPMPNMKPVYDRLFAENIETMKDAAKDYYTTERLPKKVGEKSTLTLEEMLSMKLLIPFKDSAGKSCDSKASYVEVVKMENEYLMKISLSCSTKADFVIDHIGCYNVCPNNCSNQPTQPTGVEYRFSRSLYNSYKVVNGKYTEYEHAQYKNVLDGYTYKCEVGTPDPKNEKNCIVKKGTTVSKPATKTKTESYTASEPATKTKTVPNGTLSKPATKTKTVPNGTLSKPATKTKTVPNGTLSKPATSFTAWVDKGVVTSKTPLSLNPNNITMRDLIDIKLAQRDCDTCASYTLYIYELYTRTAYCGSNSVDPNNKANCLIPQTKTVPDCSPYADDPNHAGYCLVPQTKTVPDCSPYADDPNHYGYCLVPQTKTVPDCSPYTDDPNHAGYCLVPRTRQVPDCSPYPVDPNHAGNCLVPTTVDENHPAKETPKYKKVLDRTMWSKYKTVADWIFTGNTRTKSGSYKKYSGWVVVIPAGYTKYDVKTEYKWANTQTLEGWKPTGETRPVTLQNNLNDNKTCICK